MADDHDVDALDPFALMAAESQRLDAHFATLQGAAWDEPSQCEGWSVRDVLAHLAGSEEYNRACLNDQLGPLFASMADRGATDLDSFNAAGVDDRRDRSVGDVLDEWRRESTATRQDLEAIGGGDVTTSVGPYPARWQGFHLAAELATHADDIAVPVDPAEAEARQAWRAAVGRFMLKESKPDVSADAEDGGTRVRADDVDAVLDDDTFVALVNARTPPGPVDPAVAGAVNVMP
jgi:uncharacterized protein (TIGR03083 family)